MPLDATSAEIIAGYSALLVAGGQGPEDELDVTKMRAIMGAMRPETPGPDVAEVRDLEVKGADGAIGARLYHPEPGETLPLLVYYHGGGWVLGDLESHDIYCRAFANTAGLAVLSIDYRLAPETPYPGPFEDCFAAKEWAVANAGALSADPDRLAVGGDSAGGNLAAAVSLATRDRSAAPIAHQLLVYPCIAPRPGTDSYREFATGFGLSEKSMAWFWDLYFGGADLTHDPYATPGAAQDLAGLPATTLITAECDVLRDEGEAYAARLIAASVAVDQRRFDGTFHGFNGMVGLVPQADASLGFAAERLKAALTSP